MYNLNTKVRVNNLKIKVVESYEIVTISQQNFIFTIKDTNTKITYKFRYVIDKDENIFLYYIDNKNNIEKDITSTHLNILFLFNNVLNIYLW